MFPSHDNTIWINTDKISKIELKSARKVYWGGYVKYYTEKKGWLNGYEEGYYTEGEQGQWLGKFTKTNEHIDIQGYLHYKPKLIVYGNSLKDILFSKYFETFEEAEEFFQNNFEKFINNKNIVRV